MYSRFWIKLDDARSGALDMYFVGDRIVSAASA